MKYISIPSIGSPSIASNATNQSHLPHVNIKWDDIIDVHKMVLWIGLSYAAIGVELKLVHVFAKSYISYMQC